MTTGPRLRTGSSLLPGVLAIALFGLMALVVMNTGFTEMEGYPEGISITSEIGYALFDFTALQSTAGNVSATEPFLISFLLIAIVLDAALDASLVLAKREQEGEPVTAFSAVSGTARGEDPRPATDGGSGGETMRDSDDASGGERR